MRIEDYAINSSLFDIFSSFEVLEFRYKEREIEE